MNERGAAFRAAGGRKVSTDWAVPYRRLGARRCGVRAPSPMRHGVEQAVIYGHAGNGHPHQNFIARDAAELRRIEAVVEETLREVLAMGGTVAAEHGIGKIKRRWLPMQATPLQLRMMRAIKTRARSASDCSRRATCCERYASVTTGVRARYGAVVFDVDSTLSGIEGIDWLAERRGEPLATEIRVLTEQAMAGAIPLEAVYERRLALIRPTRAELRELGAAYVDAVQPGARALCAALLAAGCDIAVISGGLREAILPLAASRRHRRRGRARGRASTSTRTASSLGLRGRAATGHAAGQADRAACAARGVRAARS